MDREHVDRHPNHFHLISAQLKSRTHETVNTRQLHLCPGVRCLLISCNALEANLRLTYYSNITVTIMTIIRIVGTRLCTAVAGWVTELDC